MAHEMQHRLNGLYVTAVDRDGAMMNAGAAGACSRWCTPETSHAEVESFIEHQISCLDGFEDRLSGELRDAWRWLGAEVGPAPAATPVRPRRRSFAGRREAAAARMATAAWAT